MPNQSFRQLLCAACPQIHYLETESPEAFEGECRLWQRDDCTVIIDLPHGFSGSLKNVAQTIAAQLAWLEQQRDTVLNSIAADAALCGSLQNGTGGLNAVYAAFFVADEQDICCDLALAEADWPASGRTLDITLEADFSLTLNGWSTAA